MNRKYITFASLFTLMTILSGIGLVCSTALADDSTVSTVSVSVDVACSLTSTEDTPHTTSIPNGTYRADIGTTTLKVLCNDSGGFAVYAIGYSGLEFGNNKMLATVDGNLAPAYDIVTGTSQNGDTSNWAMKLTKVTDTTASYNPSNLTINNSFDSYHTVPTTYTKVATYNSVTDAILGSKLTTTYAAYIAGTQPAGTYEGKVKYTLVHPSTETPLQPQTPTSGCINYFANASNAVGTMGCQSATDSNTITLLASNFSRDGYGFAGWSDKFDYATNQNAKFYGPNEDITVPEGTTANGLALYAVWIKSEGSIQDTDKVASLCGTNGVGGSLTTAPTNGTANLTSVSALTDQRDNQTYAIARLADNNCWMIENLRLESTAEHNSDGTLAQGYGTSATYGNFGGLATAESANFLDSTTANSLYYSGTQSGDATINIGTTDYPGFRMPRYNNINTSARASSPTNNSVAMYSYGNYYNWPAAIADTAYYSGGDHNTTSLCPSGWQIPLGNTSMGNIDQGASDTANRVPGFSYLDRKMGGTGENQSTAADSLRWRKFPVNLLYSGYFDTSSVYNRDTNGDYWSSTSRYNYGSYSLRLGRLSVHPGTGDSRKHTGRSIRCTVSAGT